MSKKKKDIVLIATITWLVFLMIGCSTIQPVTDTANDEDDGRNASYADEAISSVSAEEGPHRAAVRDKISSDDHDPSTIRAETIDRLNKKAASPEPRKFEADKSRRIGNDAQQYKLDKNAQINPKALNNSKIDHKIQRKSESEEPVVINFDDADLHEVMRFFADYLNINYVLEVPVQGKVTIHTTAQMTRRELFPLFFEILEINGFTAIKEGNLYKIIETKNAPRKQTPFHIGDNVDDIAPGERIIIQLIPLEFVATEEMTKLLEPFVSSNGTIVSHKETNTLLLVDKSTNIPRILNLVNAFDVNVFESTSHRFYPLIFLDPEEMSQLLNDILSAYGINPKEDIKLIPIDRLNLLMAISTSRYIMEKVDELVRQMDVPGEDDEPKIYVYFVKNGDADDLSNLLNSVFEKDQEGESASKKTDVTEPKAPTPDTPVGAVRIKDEGKIVAGKSQAGASTLKGDIKIVADKTRNALIIEVIPSDYLIVKEILEMLDVLPRQVLIEVTVADLSLDESTELGMEWEYVKGSGNLSTSLLSASVGSSGLQYLVGQTNRWTAALSALASKNKVNILSSPTVLASDNKPAKIDISTEIPVASAEYQYDAGTEPVIQTNIQYRNTGVILTVTPHINEYGLVSMDVSQEVSEQSESVQVGTTTSPSFFKRSVQTTLTVKHGQTIVIGGLMREIESKGFSGVPCIGDIPLLQYIVGKKKKSKEKTELIVLITPHVIANLDEVDAVTEEFKNKVSSELRFQRRLHQ